MNDSSNWRAYWDRKSGLDVSDYEFDRGADPRPAEIEELSTREFLEFAAPSADEVVLDAGCGTGANIVQLHALVRYIIAVDFADEAVARCRRRIEAQGITNAEIHSSSVTSLRLPDHSVDKVLCMSVLHYLGDAEVRTAFREFARVLRPNGVLILHVKNSASIYLSTLRLLKKAKMLFGLPTTLEHFRPFSWYQRELIAAGFELEHYNSFNLLVLEGMPRRLVQRLQRLELARHKQFPFRLGFLRRHGADLKLRAKRLS